ncbi:unnamed protein product, partial [Tetraodon nigroviridis]
EMPDLSHLTEEERKIILGVMERQKNEEAKEQSMLKRKAQLNLGRWFSGITELVNNVLQGPQKSQNEKEPEPDTKLHQQFESYKEQVKKMGEETKPAQDQKSEAPNCGICHKTKFADGCGHLCSYCQTKFCARCGGRVSLRSNKVMWVCNLCRKQQEILTKSGAWFYGSGPGQVRGVFEGGPQGKKAKLQDPSLYPYQGTSGDSTPASDRSRLHGGLLPDRRLWTTVRGRGTLDPLTWPQTEHPADGAVGAGAGQHRVSDSFVTQRLGFMRRGFPTGGPSERSGWGEEEEEEVEVEEEGGRRWMRVSIGGRPSERQPPAPRTLAAADISRPDDDDDDGLDRRCCRGYCCAQPWRNEAHLHPGIQTKNTTKGRGATTRSMPRQTAACPDHRLTTGMGTLGGLRGAHICTQMQRGWATETDEAPDAGIPRNTLWTRS